MLFFHKYFLFKKFFENDLDKYLTCAACVMLSMKVCNELRSLEILAQSFIKQYMKQFQLYVSIDNQLVFETSEKLCLIEFDILSKIDFDYNVDLPYKYVFHMKTYFCEYLKNSDLMKITSNFINDSFTLPLCLYFDPLLIALASLYLASYYFKIKLPDYKEGIKWYQIIDNSVQLNDIKFLCAKINKIYKYNCENNNSKNKLELIVGMPIIKFEPARNLKIIENNNESNLDVIEDKLGFKDSVDSKIDFSCPSFS